MIFFYSIALKKLISSFLIILLLASCREEPQKVRLMGETQGTYYALTYFDKENRDFRPEVDSILHAFDLSLSMWIPSSIISRINAGDTSVIPDQWFTDVFSLSQQIGDRTGGAFDFTVGPLVNAWGFGFKHRMDMDSLRVDSLVHYVDYRKVSMKDGRIFKPVGVQFDFNAIAQGYAVDVLGHFLESKGIQNYLVDIGGEVLAKGAKPGNGPWIVGIENPARDSLSERTINTRVMLHDKALATSGNYRKYYEENGIRYSHTIDPSTGYPVRHSMLSVSVLADNAAIADGYATAFMVLGLERSKQLVEKMPGLDAFFIYSAQDSLYMTYATEGFRKIIMEEEN